MKKIKLVLIATAILSVVFMGAACSPSQKTSSNETPPASTEKEKAPAQSTTTYKDGTYEGISTSGMDGEVKVEVKVAGGKIAEVTVTSHNETEGIGTAAVDKLPGAIVEAQSVEVDNVTGASKTSTAIKEAVTSALEQAK